MISVTPYIYVDAANDFIKLLQKRKSPTPFELMKAWEEHYSRNYPELYRLQVECYGEAGASWREIALKHVFNKLWERLLLIQEAHENIRQAVPAAYRKFEEFWSLGLEVIFVVYVGIGCGAGWATQYKDKYAVLLGLENIAELEWHSRDSLEGLTLHELAHIAHMALRGLKPKEFEELESDPLFLLYSEGFATRAEHLMMGRETWRIAKDREWLEWCKQNIGELACEYLRRVAEGAPVNDFYGSWLSIAGKSQVGYYLGHKLIKSLEEHMDLKTIAKLSREDVGRLAKKFLIDNCPKASA